VSALTTPEQFASWAWRVPFLASAALVAVGLYVRLGVAESPVFLDVLRASAARRVPALDVLRGHTRTVLLAAGSYLSISTLGYLALVYFVSYATRTLGFALTTTLALLSVAAVVFAASILVFGRLSDRVGRLRFAQWGCGALALWSLVFFPLIDSGSVLLAGLALCGMCAIQGAYIGPQAAVFAELFPATVRYSGASLALTLATIVGGAVAPFIATALFSVTNDSSLITTYAASVSVVSWLCTLRLEETHGRSLRLES
jgi:MFS family permease